MTRNRKIRFVVGLFDALADLRRALEALAGVGLSGDQLCVLATNQGATESPSPDLLPELAGAGLSQILVRPLDGERHPKVIGPARPPGRDALDPRRAIDPAVVAEFLARLGGRQARQLEDQLLLGGTLLFVRVTDADEQTAVGRTLLRHARNGVQTHDLVA